MYMIMLQTDVSRKFVFVLCIKHAKFLNCIFALGKL